MLLDVRISNVLSFRDETVFSLIPAKKTKQHPDHVLKPSPQGKVTALPMALVFGANASGKSNLFKAMAMCRTFVLDSPGLDKPTGFIPFRLAEETRSAPCRFEWRFVTKGKLYWYGLVADERRVYEEWLYGGATGKRQVRYYQREYDAVHDRYEWEFGDVLATTAKDRGFLGYVAQGTRENQAFLVEAAGKNVNGIVDAFTWFWSDLIFIEQPHRPVWFLPHVSSNDDYRRRLSAWLRAAGTGIDTIEVHPIETIESDRFLRSLPDATKTQLEGKILDVGNEYRFFLPANENGQPTSRIFYKPAGESNVHRLDIHYFHNGSLANSFNDSEESRGTQQLVRLWPVLDSVVQQDTTYIIDEFDTSLHPLLSKFILKTLLSTPRPEGACGQLVLNTHESSLLDLDLLRRDEIYFVEKDQNGASHLTSLAEYHVRDDLRLDKGYLQGRFGAIPYLGSPEALRLGQKEA